MKKRGFITLITGVMFLFFSMTLMAQDPPPPPGDPSSNGGTLPVGGGAPLGSGLIILVFLGLTYGYKKYRDVAENN